MWRVVLSMLLAGCGFAGEIRVGTWNLQWFPSGGPVAAAPEAEEKRIAQVAEVIRKAQIDILLLQEVRDAKTCQRLVGLLNGFNVAVCSTFREPTGTVGWQQLAILSRLPVVSAWSESWKRASNTDPPRGFAYAVLQADGRRIGCYSVHLKSNLTRGAVLKETELNILKREIAAEQLLDHATEMLATREHALSAIVIGGDFNTDLDQEKFVSEGTLRRIAAAGFESGFEGVPLKERVTCPGNGGIQTRRLTTSSRKD